MTVQIENIDQFNHYFGQTTHHPQISVARLQEADLSLFTPTDFGMYCVVLMEADFGELVLRDKCMRYRPGTMFTMKPGDIVSMHLDPDVRPRGWMLAFRPEQLNGTGLGRDFYMFNFFEYKVAEALELTDSERRVIINCFQNILTELEAPDDELTNHMLRLCISQLLTSCRRLYDRQFDTEKVRPSEFMKRLEALIGDYFSQEHRLTEKLGVPSVAWCAEQFHLTPGYFAETMRRISGITPQSYLQEKIIERAKSLLADERLTVNEVARLLGFTYSNHFARMFHQKMGMSPSEFRKQLL